MIKQFFPIAVCLIPLACASSTDYLPADIEGNFELLKLASPGHILVEQTFRNKRETCRSVRDALAVSIKGKTAVALSVTCDEAAGTLVTQTKSVLPVGEYSISLPKYRRRYSPKPARLSVRYANADFASSEDKVALGAEGLEPNSKAKGEVHYHAGDQTDWVRLKGKNASVSLLFVPSGEGAKAEVFTALPGGSGERKLGELTSSKPRSFGIHNDDLLVRIQARERSGATSYSILRRDSEAVRRARVQVVDCYPIGSGMGVAVLKVVEGVQVGDAVVISASNAEAKRRTLGKCTVTSVNGADASCELPYSDTADWVDFRAEGVFSGGKA